MTRLPAVLNQKGCHQVEMTSQRCAKRLCVEPADSRSALVLGVFQPSLLHGGGHALHTFMIQNVASLHTLQWYQFCL